MSRWRDLVTLALRERELIETGLWDELVALGRERERLVAELPARAPAEAAPYLEEAHAIVSASITTLRHAVSDITAELAHVEHGRRALAAYAGRSGAGVDLRG